MVKKKHDKMSKIQIQLCISSGRHSLVNTRFPPPPSEMAQLAANPPPPCRPVQAVQMLCAMERVCIVGSGNWGSAIAKIVGKNVSRFPQTFHTTVNMWVYPEQVKGDYLHDIINKSHENVKYLPGVKIPENIVAVSELADAAKDASILIFVLPHQFVLRTLPVLRSAVRNGCKAVSLIKGVDSSSGNMELISQTISRNLNNMHVSVLMGANIANEVAQEHFCESTLGSRRPEDAELFVKLFQTNYFRINATRDVEAVELCGALKNVVAVAAGFVDGLKMGDNTKAAIIRIGLLEIMRFCRIFYPSTKESTFFESCGVADVITTCFGGRNRRIAEAFAANGGAKSIEKLESELLNGQKLQGPDTAHDIHKKLCAIGKADEFPLFTSVYRICYEGAPILSLFSSVA